MLSLNSSTIGCLAECQRAVCAFVLLLLICGGSSAEAQEDDLPFEIFGDAIDNGGVYRHLEKQAVALVGRQPDDTVKRLQSELKEASTASDIDRDTLPCHHPENRKELYQHMVKSSVYLGELYNCGRCDKTHAGFSGGVIISENGLVLTNYHVLEQREKKNQVEGFMAMTYDGKCWEIEKVLAANKNADIALVQLKKSDGDKFHAAPIADVRPDPTDIVRVISHPSGEFFVMTRGEVSRYSRRRAGRRRSAEGHWMEITADFGGGSSGSGVFNARGEVVGLVSRIRPLIRGPRSDGDEDDSKNKTKSRNGFVEMVLRKCVPLSAIHNCFQQ